MEFLELLLVLIALILIIKKPEKENLAFGLVMVAWLLMVFFYVVGGKIKCNHRKIK
ncbi:dihydroneopterin aldolase [Campylobacter jejuni]